MAHLAPEARIPVNEKNIIVEAVNRMTDEEMGGIPKDTLLSVTVVSRLPSWYKLFYNKTSEENIQAAKERATMMIKQAIIQKVPVYKKIMRHEELTENDYYGITPSEAKILEDAGWDRRKDLLMLRQYMKNKKKYNEMGNMNKNTSGGKTRRGKNRKARKSRKSRKAH